MTLGCSQKESHVNPNIIPKTVKKLGFQKKVQLINGEKKQNCT